MPQKPTREFAVIKVKHVTVSADTTLGAVIALEVDGKNEISLFMVPEVLASLEAMLAKASLEQARHHPVQ
ncbi:hypothetical protein AB4099_07030 [Bosea sp. 2KB_26]|jgi:hypothetical protein|uniref:hypothetical protein n=1 Tax=unclassified Bosea (in: a-proteobacteria) TaxID=2653178 RepID=UPI000DE56C30